MKTETAPVAHSPLSAHMIAQLTAVLAAAGAPEFDAAYHAAEWAASVKQAVNERPALLAKIAGLVAALEHAGRVIDDLRRGHHENWHRQDRMDALICSKAIQAALAAAK